MVRVIRSAGSLQKMEPETPSLDRDSRIRVRCQEVNSRKVHIVTISQITGEVHHITSVDGPQERSYWYTPLSTYARDDPKPIDKICQPGSCSQSGMVALNLEELERHASKLKYHLTGTPSLWSRCGNGGKESERPHEPCHA